VRLYNTPARALTSLPEDDPVRLYVCGVTPYDTTHVGHAFTFVVYDVLVRYLRYRGRTVHYIQNITNVDDDILTRARRDGIDYRTLAEQQTRCYMDDMRNLNVLPADTFPKASEEIAPMQEMIARLLRDGNAYESGGNIYFSVASDPDYAAFARLSREEMLQLARERGGDPDDTRKRDPLDFLLWQQSAPGDPAWDSPWGQGRPGWHIECSAMSLKYLGPQLQIHGGGSDLIFPHHAGERAQSEAYTGVRPFAQVWMHTAMVRLNGEKMSKSRGNLIMVHDLLRRSDSDAVRCFLLRHHYRESWEYREIDVQGAARCTDLMREALGHAGGSGAQLDVSPLVTQFHEAMDEDLGTPGGMLVLDRLASEITEAARRGQSVRTAQEQLATLSGVMGLRLTAERPVVAAPAGS
jgi:L-cysteine:1D-myo-inositol 2-amino-2-deoxy-alpha-D-glucopyranoside ligase